MLKIWHFALPSFLSLFLIELTNLQILVGIFFTFFIYFVLDLGWHRYFAHKSLKVSKSVEDMFLFFGVFTGLGSPITFISTHRWHHKYSDTEKDIHSPYHSTILDILCQNVNPGLEPLRIVRQAKDWIKDKRMIFYHNHSYKILIAIIAVICFYDYTWLVPLIAGPVLISYTSGVLIAAILQHIVGERTGKDRSGNSKLLSYLSLGFISGHANHHKYPGNWTWSINDDHFDIGGVLVKKLGWNRTS